MIRRPPRSTPSPFTSFFFFNDTATTEIYTLSLHDALPIFPIDAVGAHFGGQLGDCLPIRDRKSTRLNSSHGSISYAVFCLTKNKRQPASADLAARPHHRSQAPAS